MIGVAGGALTALCHVEERRGRFTNRPYIVVVRCHLVDSHNAWWVGTANTLKRVVWCVAMGFNMIAVRGIERIRHPYTVWIGLKVTRRGAVAARIAECIHVELQQLARGAV